jgi:hypothetical protein
VPLLSSDLEMEAWDVSKLIGAHVVFSADDAEGASHEARGTIVAVLNQHSAEKEAEATNLSEFSVKTDAGQVISALGSSFSRIDPAVGQTVAS